jgi:hypothetical protein
VRHSDGADVADALHEKEPTREYYSKFHGGFVGHFGKTETFHGGLDQMIGECRKDISKAIEEEHTAVSSGFGASNEPFMTPNYNIMTTVAREFNFCLLGERDSPPLYDKKRVEIKMGQETTPRRVKDVKALHKNAAALITESFEKSKNEFGFDSSVTVTEEMMTTEIKLLLEEVCDLASSIYLHGPGLSSSGHDFLVPTRSLVSVSTLVPCGAQDRASLNLWLL